MRLSARPAAAIRAEAHAATTLRAGAQAPVQVRALPTRPGTQLRARARSIDA